MLAIGQVHNKVKLQRMKIANGNAQSPRRQAGLEMDPFNLDDTRKRAAFNFLVDKRDKTEQSKSKLEILW